MINATPAAHPDGGVTRHSNKGGDPLPCSAVGCNKTAHGAQKCRACSMDHCPDAGHCVTKKHNVKDVSRPSTSLPSAISPFLTASSSAASAPFHSQTLLQMLLTLPATSQPSLTSSAMGLLPNQGLSTAHSWPFLHPLSMLPQQYSQQQPLPQPLHFTQPPMQQQAPTAPPSQADQPPPWPTHLPTTAPLPFGSPAYRPMPPS
jgi:hypothetical protein